MANTEKSDKTADGCNLEALSVGKQRSHTDKQLKKGSERKSNSYNNQKCEYRYARPFDYFLLILGIMLSLTQGFLQALHAYVFKGLSDTLVEGERTWGTKDFDEAKFHDGAMVAVYLYSCYGIGIFVLSTVSMSCWHTLCERQIQQIRNHYFAAVLQQNMSWFDVHQSGELMTKISETMERIRDGTGDKMGILFTYGAAFIGGLIVAVVCSWRITLIMLAFIPVLAGLTYFLTSFVSTSAGKEMQAYEKAGTVAEEVIGGIRTVIALNGQRKETERYHKALKKAAVFGRRKALFIALGTAWIFCLVFIAMGISFWYGTKLYNDGIIQPGAIFATFWAIIAGTISLGMAAAQIGAIVTAQNSAKSIFEVIDRVPEIDCQSPEGSRIVDLKGEIEFKDIHFHYPTRPEEEVLKGVSFKVKAEQSVALVGSSGCGKSTLIRLLLRHYNQEHGELTIDGIPVSSLNIRWLRQIIGIVSQEPILFAATVEENLRLGNQEMTTERMEEVCRTANAHNFIRQLPQGYKTRIGEGGVQLSGGQIQRIAIARALAKDPKILLLDEATSALDSESEKVVQHALKKASATRTTLTIAHRLSTIRNADRIIVLNHGEIIETGTHEELMANGRLYMKMVLTQNVDQTDKTKDTSNSAEETGIVEDDDEEVEDLLPRESFTQSSSSKLATSLNRQEVNEVEAEEFNLLRILQFARHEWPMLLSALFFAILKGFMFPIFSIIYGFMFQSLTRSTPEQRIQEAFVNALYFTFLGISCGFATFLASYLFAASGESFTRRLRVAIFVNIINQDGEYFDSPNHASGNLITRLAADAPNIRAAIDHRFADALQAVTSMVVGVGVAFYYSAKVAPMGILTMMLLILSQIALARCMKKRSEKNEMLTREPFRLAMEAIKQHETVQSLTREQYFYEKFDNEMQKAYSETFQSSIIKAFAFAIHACFIFVNFAAAYRYGLWLMETGHVTPFQVFQVTDVLNVVSMNFLSIGAYFPEYARARLSAGLVFKMLNEKPKIDSLSEGGKKEVLQGNVKLEDVQFAYPANRKSLVLNGLTMEAVKGKTVALVGSSGCGKSTVIQLIERFYDPLDGRIMFDTTDVRHLNLTNVRNRIALVSQEPILFNYSIRENIAYNLANITQEQIEEAAKLANAHGFIMETENGYDTIVGEKGGQLSGGQKQRIAVARAIIRNPEVLLLDEATSALDSESEKAVQEALEKACKGRTCIIIAHRLSSIQNSDQILVMNDGIIVESGTHQELLHHKGLYAKLIEMQNLQ
uniref:Uncharacterized protein n=1 Tax=Setaria digitata TaxID=48799 RepID=A0A915PV66_9BILA